MKWMPRVEALAHSGVCPRVIQILRQRSFWGVCAGLFCGAYYLYFILTWLPFYLVHERHLSMQQMVKTTALYYLMDAAAAVATGWLTDFCIRRGCSTTLVRKSAMAIGWTIAAIGLAGCGLSAPGSCMGWLMISAIGNGIGMSGTFAISQTLAGPHAAGRWVGLQNGVGNLAGVIGPALTGFLVDWTGNFRAAIAVTALMSLLSAINYVFSVGSVTQLTWTDQSATVVAPSVPEIA